MRDGPKAGAEAGVYGPRMWDTGVFDDEMILGFCDVGISEERWWKRRDTISRKGLVPFMRGMQGDDVI